MRSNDFSWRHSLAVTLLLLSPFDLLASLGMDMYLPVVPFMADALGADPATIQLTLTAYLVLLGAGQLLFGPLSDRVGRRPVLLAGGIVYVAASFGLALATSSVAFLSLRVLQAYSRPEADHYWREYASKETSKVASAASKPRLCNFQIESTNGGSFDP